MPLSNRDIANILEEIAILLELTDDNPFKSRAYRNAAREIEKLPEPLSHYIQSGTLNSIRGIGSNLEKKLVEIVETSSSSYLEKLRKNVPPVMLELLQIPGLGPRKVKTVVEKLGISSIGELEYACLENRLVDLPGFGPKTQQKILDGIEFLKQHSDKHLYSRVKHTADIFSRWLQEEAAVHRFSFTGEFRRQMEILDRLDILCQVSDNELQRFFEKLKSLPHMARIIKEWNNGMEFVWEGGVRCHLEIADEASFAETLFRTTGSDEHVRKVLALLHQRPDFFRNEEEIYRLAGLPYLPPEVREGMQETDLALQGNFPDLITSEHITGILHVHTNYSDGSNSLREMAEAAIEKGYQYLGISDHSRSSFYANGLEADRIRKQHEEIDALNEEFAGSFRILKGIECDILTDGTLDYEDHILDWFDFVIVSVHQHLRMDKETATRRIIRALQHPKVNILGHPTGRLILSRKGYELEWDEIIEVARKNRVAIEINANPLRLDLDWRIARKAWQAGVYLSINPDAHSIQGMDDIQYGIITARKGLIPANQIVNTWSPENLWKFFQKKNEADI